MQAAEILREAALRVASYLLDGWVEPLVPASLALLGGLADEQRRDARPLVLAVLHDGRLEDLVLRVLPHAALDHDPHLASPCSGSAPPLASPSPAKGRGDEGEGGRGRGGSGEAWGPARSRGGGSLGFRVWRGERRPLVVGGRGDGETVRRAAGAFRLPLW